MGRVDQKFPHVIELSADSDTSPRNIDAGLMVGMCLDDESIVIAEERFADYRGFAVIGVLFEGFLLRLSPDGVRGFVVNDSRFFRLLWPVQVR